MNRADRQEAMDEVQLAPSCAHVLSTCSAQLASAPPLIHNCLAPESIFFPHTVKDPGYTGLAIYNSALRELYWCDQLLCVALLLLLWLS